MKTQKIIVIRPASNARYTCEFSVNVFESYGADTPNEHRIAYGQKNFKSPVRAMKYVQELVEYTNAAIALNSKDAYLSLKSHVEIWKNTPTI